jgi:uncharacterized sodium:solute symporter family permease YidK
VTLQWVDWTIVIAYLVWIIWDGLRMSKRTDELEGYLRASRSLPWWVVGLSVMATQLSAITLVGTTGQAYNNGMRFVQNYLGLPIAMIILSLTVVPFFYRSGVFTAYEYLERRYDVKTRTLASMLFLIQRGMSCGVVIAAPSLILSIVLGWDLTLTVLAIGLPTAVYTMYGGVQAVAWTDVKQMVIIVGASLQRWSCSSWDCPTACRRQRRCMWRVRSASCSRSTSGLIRKRRTRSGRVCSVACSCRSRISAAIRVRCSAISPRSRWMKAGTHC